MYTYKLVPEKVVPLSWTPMVIGSFMIAGASLQMALILEQPTSALWPWRKICRPFSPLRRPAARIVENPKVEGEVNED